MDIIKFDLDELENQNTGFSYYLLGRSYDLEENGAYYYFGLGNIEKDYNKAFQIIKECADKGHIAAIYDLGANFYFNGNGTDINYDLADYYLNLSKENGLKRAIDLYDARGKTKEVKIIPKIDLSELVISARVKKIEDKYKGDL